MWSWGKKRKKSDCEQWVERDIKRDEGGERSVLVSKCVPVWQLAIPAVVSWWCQDNLRMAKYICCAWGGEAWSQCVSLRSEERERGTLNVALKDRLFVHTQEPNRKLSNFGNNPPLFGCQSWQFLTVYNTSISQYFNCKLSFKFRWSFCLSVLFLCMLMHDWLKSTLNLTICDGQNQCTVPRFDNDRK